MTVYEILLNLLWILGGLFIILYPAILLAGVMSLAGKPAQTFTLKAFVFRVFLIVTLLYPFITYFCFKISRQYLEEGDSLRAVLYTLPSLCIGGMVLWVLKRKK